MKSLGFNEKIQTDIFVISANGGILYQFYEKHGTRSAKGGNTQMLYTSHPAFPMRKRHLADHLQTGKPKEAIDRELLKQK